MRFDVLLYTLLEQFLTWFVLGVSRYGHRAAVDEPRRGDGS